MTARDTFLLGDIGGTNARFALATDGTIGPIAQLAVSEYGRIEDAIGAFLSRQQTHATIYGAVLGVAGPIEHERGLIINSGWTIDAAALRAAFGFAAVRLLNDFEAVAYSLPWLIETDLQPLGGGAAEPRQTMVVLGPGTGLGVAALVPGPDGPIAVATEGGHADLPGTSVREDAIIANLRERFGHVSAERALSGPGLENLYQAIAHIDGATVEARTAAQITSTALDGSCAVCRAALDTFCAMLGSVAGNLALIYGAHGGVFIAGGIAPRIVDHLARSAFRARFAAKGRFQGYLEAIPTSVIVNPHASFLGLQAIAERLG